MEAMPARSSAVAAMRTCGQPASAGRAPNASAPRPERGHRPRAFSPPPSWAASLPSGSRWRRRSRPILDAVASVGLAGRVHAPTSVGSPAPWHGAMGSIPASAHNLSRSVRDTGSAGQHRPLGARRRGARRPPRPRRREPGNGQRRAERAAAGPVPGLGPGPWLDRRFPLQPAAGERPRVSSSASWGNALTSGPPYRARRTARASGFGVAGRRGGEAPVASAGPAACLDFGGSDRATSAPPGGGRASIRERPNQLPDVRARPVGGQKPSDDAHPRPRAHPRLGRPQRVGRPPACRARGVGRARAVRALASIVATWGQRHRAGRYCSTSGGISSNPGASRSFGGAVFAGCSIARIVDSGDGGAALPLALFHGAGDRGCDKNRDRGRQLANGGPRVRDLGSGRSATERSARPATRTGAGTRLLSTASFRRSEARPEKKPRRASPLPAGGERFCSRLRSLLGSTGCLPSLPPRDGVEKRALVRPFGVTAGRRRRALVPVRSAGSSSPALAAALARLGRTLGHRAECRVPLVLLGRSNEFEAPAYCGSRAGFVRSVAASNVRR